MKDTTANISTPRAGLGQVSSTGLSVGFAASLILHAAVLSLPGGRGMSPYQPSHFAVSPAAAQAMPLSVRLGPAFQPAVAERSKHAGSAQAALLSPMSPAVTSTEGFAHASSNLAGDGALNEGQAGMSPGMPIDVYFEADKTSVRPAPLSEIDFDQPEFNLHSGNGKAVLVLYINESGRVDRVETEATGAISEALLQAMAKQFGKALFIPAQIDGQAVKSRMRIEILLRPLLKP